MHAGVGMAWGSKNYGKPMLMMLAWNGAADAGWDSGSHHLPADAHDASLAGAN